MKVKLKFDSWIPKLLGADGVTLYPYIFFKASKEECIDNIKSFTQLFKHEMIHVEQVERMGWFKFYLSYLFTSRSKEHEAYHRQYEKLTKRDNEVLEQLWVTD